MSEIEDLNPRPERQPAEAPITAGQMALYIAAHGSGRPCEACGGTDWRAHDEA